MVFSEWLDLVFIVFIMVRELGMIIVEFFKFGFEVEDRVGRG